MTSRVENEETRRKELQAMVAQGFKLLGQRRGPEAERFSNEVLKRYPDEPLARYLASEIALQKGESDTALAFVNTVEGRDADCAVCLIQKAKILLGLRERRQAIDAARKAVSLSSDNAAIFRAAGTLFSQCEEFEAAKDSFEKAVQFLPDDLPLLFELATTYFFLGYMEKAEVCLNTILEKSPQHGNAVHLRTKLRRQTQVNNHIKDLETRAKAGFKDWQTAMYFNFALAKEYEDLADYDNSFRYLREGTKIKRQHLDYNAANEKNNINDLIRFYAADVFTKQQNGFKEKGPIFIVGMPRTGTTLVERILSSHSQVVSAGEVSDFPISMTEQVHKTLALKSGEGLTALTASLAMDFNELGQNYENSVRQKIGSSKYFIDKLPFNYLYCGLIHKALPDAKIFHLVRDPMDSCYAIYKTLFNQVYNFSYDLEELGDYYLLYRKLMKHWHSVMPGIIIDVAYENVVEDPEKQARFLLESCELPWESSVLDFHTSRTASSTASAAQVREPVYTTSIQKWRHYESQLEPLKKILIAGGIVDEDGNPL